MTYENWVAAGRPHWQCRECLSIYVTIPQADDFVCHSCKTKNGSPKEKAGQV